MRIVMKPILQTNPSTNFAIVLRNGFIVKRDWGLLLNLPKHFLCPVEFAMAWLGYADQFDHDFVSIRASSSTFGLAT